MPTYDTVVSLVFTPRTQDEAELIGPNRTVRVWGRIDDSGGTFVTSGGGLVASRTTIELHVRRRRDVAAVRALSTLHVLIDGQRWDVDGIEPGNRRSREMTLYLSPE